MDVRNIGLCHFNNNYSVLPPATGLPIFSTVGPYRAGPTSFHSYRTIGAIITEKFLKLLFNAIMFLLYGNDRKFFLCRIAFAFRLYKYRTCVLQNSYNEITLL